jgi:hypothetical protein
VRIDLYDALRQKILNTLSLAPAKQFFHSSQLQRAKADFGVLNGRVLMISNSERLSDGKIAIIFHEKIGLLWIVFGCIFIIVALLNFFGKANIDRSYKKASSS